MNPIKGILNRCLWKDKNSITCITSVTHDAWESDWVSSLPELTCYSMVQDGTIDGWRGSRQKPDRYIVLPKNSSIAEIPKWVDPHVVVCQNVAAQQFLFQIAQYYNVPLINVVHTYRSPNMPRESIEQYHRLPVKEWVFITRDSCCQWGFDEQQENVHVVYHGMNADLYKRRPVERGNYAVAIANEYIERWECGFPIFAEIAKGAPVKHFGTSSSGRIPNNPTRDFNHLLDELSSCGVFLNTAVHSPFSRALAEALFMECAVVSVAECDVPNILTHDKDALLFPKDRPDLGRKYVQHLLTNKKDAERIAKTGRETAMKVFNIDRFSSQWRQIFSKAIKEF